MQDLLMDGMLQSGVPTDGRLVDLGDALYLRACAFVRVGNDIAVE